MKILLVQPAPFEPGRLGLENVLWLSEPVGLTQVAAAVLPDGHDVRILDMRLEPDLALNEVLLEFRPDIVGTTSMTTDCYQARAILAVAKGTLGDDRCFTVVGGHHPTLSPEDFEDPCVDAMCIGEGEETFAELVAALDAGDRQRLSGVRGLRLRQPNDTWLVTPPRAQNRALDSFPAPARHLLKPEYRRSYFFSVASPMASMETSRGCSFDCNFCAIWEFYERKTRYMSAKAICDRLEEIDEEFVFFLDDNFLTHRKRLEELCDEIERRGIRKYYGTQGRSDFIADNPETMRRLRDAGFVMVLSGYEGNADDQLELLRKRNTADNNRKAAQLMRDLGMISTGIFMARPDFSEQDFDDLYGVINDMGVAIPLVVLLTPLPGTQLWKERRDELLTTDFRFYDLLHSVLPTTLPRARFYAKFTQQADATMPAFYKGVWAALRRRPGFFVKALPGTLRFLKRVRAYRPIACDPESHLRDEIGVIDEHARALPQPNPSVAEAA